MTNRAGVTLAALLLAGTAAAQDDVMDLSRLRTVALPDAPPAEVDVVLHARWTLDCGDDPAFMLGVVDQAAAGPDSTVLLVDRGLDQVLVIGADGACLAVRGRTGEGPGELSGLFCAAPLGGGRLVLAQGMPPETYGVTAGKVVILDAAGHPAGGFDFRDPAASGSDWPTLRGLRTAGDRMLVGLFIAHVEPPNVTAINRLLLCDDTGAVQAVLGDHRVTTSFLDADLREENIFEPYTLDRFDLAADGRVVFLPTRDTYEVCVVDAATGEGLRVTADRAGRSRTRAEREDVAARNGGEGGTFATLPAEPALRGVRFRPDGAVWVALGRDPGAAAADFGTFDEIGPDGAWRRRVHLHAPGDAAADRLIMLSDGRFVLVRGLEAVDTGDEGIAVTLVTE